MPHKNEISFGYEYNSQEVDPNADKQGLGFTEKSDKIVSYSKEYEGFSEFKLNNKRYAIVKHKGLFGVVDAQGKPMAPNYEAKYKTLVNGVAYYDTVKTVCFAAEDKNGNKWSMLTKEGKVVAKGLDFEPNYGGITCECYNTTINGRQEFLDLKGRIIKRPEKTYKQWATTGVFIDTKGRYYCKYEAAKGVSYYIDENGIEYQP